MTYISNISRPEGDPKVLQSGRSSLGPSDQLSRALGWFSIALGVTELVDPQLRRQVEELAGLGVVLDRLGARLVQRHQPIVLLRLAIGLPQGDERLGVGRIPLQGGFVFANGGHARVPYYCEATGLRATRRPAA